MKFLCGSVHKVVMLFVVPAKLKMKRCVLPTHLIDMCSKCQSGTYIYTTDNNIPKIKCCLCSMYTRRSTCQSGTYIYTANNNIPKNKVLFM